MELSIGTRLKNAWNTFKNRDPTRYSRDLGASFSMRPDRTRYYPSSERTIVAAICNRIAMDCAAIDIRHVRLDDNGRFLEEIDSGLNNCLSVEANVDQSGRAFVHDMVASMLDEGVVAVVPTDIDDDPKKHASAEILTMRVAKILEWYPRHVRVKVYNESTGLHEELILPKGMVAIIENPMFPVMNEPNSTLRRLTRKLALLDAVDEQTSSGKLDLIIQLPYVVKTEARRQQAEQRREDIERQLSEGKYGIAYTDGTERVTQLNRPVENNLMAQIEYLTSMLYSQLSMSQSVMDGTADEKTMLNYNNRIIEPILSTITSEFIRKYLSKTARTQRQSVKFFRDPFKLVPVNDVAEIADKFTRNEIMTSNEIRQIVGMKPSKDPSADELRNKNLSAPTDKALSKPEMQTALNNQEIPDPSGILSQLPELNE